MENTGQVDQEEHHSLDNPADRPLVTFDANIVIALRNNEADAQPARQLLALNCAGVITVNITLSTALEEQRPDEQQEMHEYSAWLQEQGHRPWQHLHPPAHRWLSPPRRSIRHHYVRSSA